MTTTTAANGAAPAPDGGGTVDSLINHLYAFMMENIPYRYDEGAKPHVMTQDDPLAAQQDDPQTGPGGMIYSALGQAAPNNYDTPLTKDAETRIRENPQDSIWWTFGSKSYRVTKALRIPYVVMQDGVEVVKHILVGYSGIDGGG